MKVYLANWCTEGDYDAMRDDGGYDSVADQAFPSGVVVKSIDEAKAACIVELYDVDDELPPRNEVRWDEDGDGRYTLIHEVKGVDVIAVMIVREFEL